MFEGTPKFNVFEILSTNKIVDFTLLLFMSTYGIVIKFVLESVGYNHKFPRKNQIYFDDILNIDCFA